MAVAFLPRTLLASPICCENRGRHVRPACDEKRIFPDKGSTPFRWLILGVVILSTGCESGPSDQLELRIDPFERLRPEDRRLQTEILYATDRDPADSGDAERFYANRRGYLVRFGQAIIAHGNGGVSWDEARRVSLASERKEPYLLRVGAVEEIGILARSASPFVDPALLPEEPVGAEAKFAAAVNLKLEKSKSRDIVIYVHGYKVPFEDPLLVAAELWHFMGYDGVFIPYSWPSTPRALAYFSDIETATLSAHYLRLLVKYLSEHTDAKRVHILGYSAGTRLVIDALSMIAMDGKGLERGVRIGEVILVGSDYDTGLFAAALTNGILEVTNRLTLYLSGIDRALRFSSFFFGRERLGEILDRDMPEHVRALLRKRDDLVLIDVTDAENAGARNGHAYFRASPWVSSDILATLAYGLGPAQRGLVQADPTLPIWSYPTDFIERLRAGLAASGTHSR
jgi:esterase/lipase superfamily enzyme